MATWIFKRPPEELEEEQLRDELADILFASDNENEIDLSALDRILDLLDKKCPLPDDLPSVEESLAAFHAKYEDLFKKLQAQEERP